MEKIIFEFAIWEIILIAIMIFVMTFMIVFALNLSLSYEFHEVPFINRWFTGRGDLYREGYNDGLEHKTIKEYDLKRDRKIRLLKKRMYRAQERYEKFYLNVLKEKHQRDEK